MADILSTIKFLVVGDAASAEKAFKATSKAATAAAGDLEKPAKSGALMGAAIGAALLTGAAAAVKFSKESVDAFKSVAGETAKLSRLTGMTAEESSRLRFALKMTGVDADVFAKSIGKFEKTLVTAAQTGKGTAAMTAALGTSFLDASGKVLPMAQLLPLVADRFKSMPNGAEKTALAMQLFGKTGADLIPFLNKGASGLAELAAKSDKFGLTLDSGAISALTRARTAQREWDASLQGLQVPVGATVLPLLNHLTTGLTGVLSAVRENGAVLGPVTTLVGGLAGALGVLAVATKVREGIAAVTGGVRDLQNRLTELGASTAASGSAKLGGAISMLGRAIPVAGAAALVAGAAFVYFSAKAEATKQNVEALTSAIKQDSGALGENTRSTIANILQKKGAYEAAKKAGITQAELTTAVVSGGTALDSVRQKMALYEQQQAQAAVGAGDGAQRISDAGRILQDVLQSETGELRDAKVAAENLAAGTSKLADATDEAAPSAEELAARTKEVTDASKKAAESIKKTTDAIWGNVDAVLAASGNAMGWESSLAKASETIKKNGNTWDKSTGQLKINTEAGRDNKAALDDMVKASAAVIKGMVDSDAPMSKVTDELERQHKAFVKAATGATGSKERAEELWASYKLNPGVVETLIRDKGLLTTQQKVDAYLDRLDEIPASKQTEYLAAIDAKDLARGQAMLDDVARTRYAKVNVQIQMPSTGIAIGSTRLHADGAVYYGAGGFHENHVAQIAPAGAWRIWAEDETGGESYIPLAPSKRARSLAIWRETGRRLGVMPNADGGVSQATSIPAMGDAFSSAVVAALYSAARDGSRDGTAEGMAASMLGRQVDSRISLALAGTARGMRR